MTKIRLTGWKIGMQKISMTKILQNRIGLPLPTAKRLVDDLLEGRSPSIDLPLGCDAHDLVVVMRGLGAVCDIEPE